MHIVVNNNDTEMCKVFCISIIFVGLIIVKERFYHLNVDRLFLKAIEEFVILRKFELSVCKSRVCDNFGTL